VSTQNSNHTTFNSYRLTLSIHEKSITGLLMIRSCRLYRLLGNCIWKRLRQGGWTT